MSKKKIVTVVVIILALIIIIPMFAMVFLGDATNIASKNMANKAQEELVAQLSDMKNSYYTGLNQQKVTGAKVKIVVKDAKSLGATVLVSPLKLNSSTEIDGTLLEDSKGGNCPIALVEGEDGVVHTCVNYGAVLAESNYLTYDEGSKSFSNIDSAKKLPFTYEVSANEGITDSALYENTADLSDGTLVMGVPDTAFITVI